MRSADSFVCDNPEDQKAMELKYPPKLLNSIDTGSSLPDHEIVLKDGFVIMLLRNIRQKCGHVNGTRYIVRKMTKNLLFLRAVSGTAKGNLLVLPRMNCIPGSDDFPIPGFRRCQFPIRVCFAMTINKAQGQSVAGKARSRIIFLLFCTWSAVRCLISRNSPEKCLRCFWNGYRRTKNIVHPEVLSKIGETRDSSMLEAANTLISMSNLNIPLSSTDKSIQLGRGWRISLRWTRQSCWGREREASTIQERKIARNEPKYLGFWTATRCYTRPNHNLHHNCVQKRACFGPHTQGMGERQPYYCVDAPLRPRRHSGIHHKLLAFSTFICRWRSSKHTRRVSGKTLQQFVRWCLESSQVMQSSADSRPWKTALGTCGFA